MLADEDDENEEVPMSKAKRNRSPNDDLVEAAEDSLPHILMLYKRFEKKRPVMLLDLQSQKIYAYPYEEFKAELGEKSQTMLAADYEKAIAKNKIVVFVRDNETQRLASMLFNYE
jgi:hypothetical protein